MENKREQHNQREVLAWLRRNGEYVQTRRLEMVAKENVLNYKMTQMRGQPVYEIRPEVVETKTATNVAFQGMSRTLRQLCRVGLVERIEDIDEGCNWARKVRNQMTKAMARQVVVGDEMCTKAFQNCYVETRIIYKLKN